MEQLTKVIEKLLSEQEERFYPHEVIPENPSQLPAIGKELKEKLPHVAVIEPEKLAEAMEKAVAIFLAITAVVSVISSIVGGLLIVNTMAMAVVERRREVSIKVAIGASTGQVALEFVLEAAIMGFAGAIIGTAFGCAAIEILNPLDPEQGRDRRVVLQDHAVAHRGRDRLRGRPRSHRGVHPRSPRGADGSGAGAARAMRPRS
jgi:ABC-type lipoprotein release transport system permease subunit